MNAGQKDTGVIYFTNTKEDDITLKISALPYRTKDSTYNNPKLLVNPDLDKVTVKPSDTVSIGFTINVPSDTKFGSYLNTLLFEEEYTSSKSDFNVGLKAGIGSVLRIDVTEANKSVRGILDSNFRNKSIAKVEVISKGIPYILPTKIKYTYENSSEYIFNPIGDIRFISADQRDPILAIHINKDETSIYPGDKLEKIETINLCFNKSTSF